MKCSMPVPPWDFSPIALAGEATDLGNLNNWRGGQPGVSFPLTVLLFAVSTPGDPYYVVTGVCEALNLIRYWLIGQMRCVLRRLN